MRTLARILSFLGGRSRSRLSALLLDTCPLRVRFLRVIRTAGAARAPNRAEMTESDTRGTFHLAPMEVGTTSAGVRSRPIGRHCVCAAVSRCTSSHSSVDRASLHSGKLQRDETKTRSLLQQQIGALQQQEAALQKKKEVEKEEEEVTLEMLLIL